VANIVHDSPPGQDKKETHRDDVPPGSYRVHVINRVSGCAVYFHDAKVVSMTGNTTYDIAGRHLISGTRYKTCM